MTYNLLNNCPKSILRRKRIPFGNWNKSGKLGTISHVFRNTKQILIVVSFNLCYLLVCLQLCELFLTILFCSRSSLWLFLPILIAKRFSNKIQVHIDGMTFIDRAQKDFQMNNKLQSDSMAERTVWKEKYFFFTLNLGNWEIDHKREFSYKESARD